MSSHYWGDEDFDWKALTGCQKIIYKYHRYGFLGAHCKEKYGTLRWSPDLGWISLHALIYPGYHRNMWSRLMTEIDVEIITPVLRKVLGRPIIWWQKKVYYWIYKKMVKTYPHIKEEILEAADWPEYLGDLND